MNISVYQKDKVWVPPADLEEEANPYMNWETVNPLWWCRAATPACGWIRAAPASRRASPSRARYQEALDFYDAIEWIAKQPWCTGNIGTLGHFVSRDVRSGAWPICSRRR